MEISHKQPSYIKLLYSGELKTRVEISYSRLSACNLCPHHCGVDRLSGDKGICKTGSQARVASYGPHFGEEEPLRGHRGSGTIFFSRCNLHCQFCQNYDISQSNVGPVVDSRDLASIMLDLQERGCHNINLVSPSHVVPQILAGTLVAAQAGLNIPLVYNTGGYDAIETLRLLDGIIDIYMPDMKYSDPKAAENLSKVKNYPRLNQAAVIEMHRQVNDLSLDESSIAFRGLLIRHLVLPNKLSGTNQVVRFIADKISKNTYLNIMDQYYPSYNAQEYPELNSRITSQEYKEAITATKSVGLTRLDHHR